MKKEAILHIPMSEYAFGLDDHRVSIRLRTGRDDIASCTLFYGDRASRNNPVDFFPVPMTKVAFSSLFDYYEAEFTCPYTRILYYFSLSDKEGETILYYGDAFEREESQNRSDYFQLPYNHRADRAEVPSWAKDAIVYNIFPDSFASCRGFISSCPSSLLYEGKECKGKLGGKLKGILENLDYIESLGFNTIYLNPIFVAGEYHKYDLIDYYHIDPVFGSDEEFKALVNEIHRRNMKIIIDGVFNHCGWHFFAFEDVVKKGRASRYWSWFHRLQEPLTVPSSWEEYPCYECFGYERMMPKLALDNREVQDYFLAVGRYWVENYDIDGWRLDVASEVCDFFWIRFREEVKAIRKDCLLIGEVWESAGHWLDGKMFDSTMNYDLRRSALRFFAREDVDAEAFNSSVTAMVMRYRTPMLYAQLNLLDSHDVSRFLSECGGDRRKMSLAVVFLMTFIGMPCVFYGDEKGAEGMEEKDYRRPMPWKAKEDSLFLLYKELIALRRREKALREGRFQAESIQDKDVYIYRRRTEESAIKVILNRSPREYSIRVENILMSRGYENGIIAPYGFTISREAIWECR